MPIYTIKCEECGISSDIYRSLANYDDLPECCGKKTHRALTAPLVMTDIQPYISQIDGSIINSRSRHKTHLKDHGCIEVGNEKVTSKSMAPPPGRKDAIIRAVNETLDKKRK